LSQVCGGLLAVTTWTTGLAPASGDADLTDDYAYGQEGVL